MNNWQRHINDSGGLLSVTRRPGESQNINNAVSEALIIGGYAFTLSAKNSDNTFRSLGSLNYYVPVANPLNANLCQMEIMNYWIARLTSMVSWQEENKAFSSICSSSYERQFAGN